LRVRGVVCGMKAKTTVSLSYRPAPGLVGRQPNAAKNLHHCHPWPTPGITGHEGGHRLFRLGLCVENGTLTPHGAQRLEGRLWRFCCSSSRSTCSSRSASRQLAERFMHRGVPCVGDIVRVAPSKVSETGSCDRWPVACGNLVFLPSLGHRLRWRTSCAIGRQAALVSLTQGRPRTVIDEIRVRVGLVQPADRHRVRGPLKRSEHGIQVDHIGIQIGRR